MSQIQKNFTGSEVVVIGSQFISTSDGTVTRDADDKIETVTTDYCVTTLTRDGNGYLLTAVTVSPQGTVTKTFTRDGNNKIASWTVV